MYIGYVLDIYIYINLPEYVYRHHMVLDSPYFISPTHQHI